MADVFISYQRDERQTVERLANELRQLGLAVWFDASLNSGETFSDEIDREAHAAKAILVCWSPAARQSQWVKAEALIGFEQGKLAACYVAGPEGFRPPTPFNSVHAEDLRAWVSAPSNTDAAYKSILRRIGRLCGRADIESYGALDAQADAPSLRTWIAAHETSPVSVVVGELLRIRVAEDEKRTQLEHEAREHQAREETERRARAEAREEAGLRERIGRLYRGRQKEEGAAQTIRSARRAPWGVIIGGSVILAVVIGGLLLNAASDLRPGNTFRDCAECPEMVVIPAGRFIMGSDIRNARPLAEESSDELGGHFTVDDSTPDADEGPQRDLEVAQFAVSKFEITRNQWAACANDGGCTSNPNPNSFGSADGTMPVVDIGWDDARQYVRWLTRRTGQSYRLLTEVEWEYSARAGAPTAYSTGPNITAAQANFRSSSPAHAGTYAPNSFGLYDMHGNVWEWVEDCYSADYSDVELTRAAGLGATCEDRVLRGGGHANSAQMLRSSNRLWFYYSNRSSDVGFRVARS